MNQQQQDFMSTMGHFFLASNRLDRALILFKALHELYPENINFRKSLCYTLLKHGDHQSALYHAERISELTQEKEPMGMLLKSMALWGLERREAARETLNRFYQAQRKRRK